MRIRYFGFLANRCRAASLELCRKLIGEREPVKEESAVRSKSPATWPCPRCSAAMVIIERLSAAQALRYLNAAAGIDSS